MAPTDVGRSAETPVKYTQFRELIKMHAKMCKDMRLAAYWYLDLHAGDGDGCVHIAYEELQQTALPWAIKAVEKGEQYQALHARLGHVREIDLVHGDNQQHGPAWARACTARHRGIVLHDSNWSVDLDVLSAFASTPLDVLIYYTATYNKRVRGAYETQGVFVEDIIRAAIKQHWVIREPRGKAQWTFLYGSNWDKFQTLRWDKQHFYPLDSPEGRAIFAFINAPSNEQRRSTMQAALARTHQLALWGNL
jgi:hypothetical protein